MKNVSDCENIFSQTTFYVFVDYCLDSPCSETCEPYPGGFNCLCLQGQKLGQDGFTCQSGIGYIHQSFYDKSKGFIFMYVVSVF